ncbi:MAG: dienelactone hydrolase family protein [Caldilineales bacterium]
MRRGEFSAASVNYGALPKNAEQFLNQACPIVASYGAKDRTLKGAAGQLESILTATDVDHDVKEYPGVDHAFMNDHSQDKIPFLIHVVGFVFGGGAYDAAAAQDSAAGSSHFSTNTRSRLMPLAEMRMHMQAKEMKP